MLRSLTSLSLLRGASFRAPILSPTPFSFLSRAFSMPVDNMQAPKPEIAENPIVEVTVDNFMPEVLHFKGPLLLDCYAE